MSLGAGCILVWIFIGKAIWKIINNNNNSSRSKVIRIKIVMGIRISIYWKI